MIEIAWRTGLSEADQRRIRSLFDAAKAHDGTAPVGDQVLRELAQDRSRHLLAEDGGDLVGYLDLVPASAEAPAMAEVVVHPDTRRRGIGSTLIATGLAEGGPGARIWAHGNLAPARATAAGLGLTVARELLQMRRPLSGLPPVALPADVVMRTYAGPEDDVELLRVNNAAFSWHPEQGGWTEAEIAERRAESWFDPAGLFLAFDGETGGLLGFHWTKVHSHDLGEVYVVGVDPDAQGRGLGKALTLVGLQYLAKQLEPGGTVMLYVEADNVAAVRTYQRLDFEVFTSDVAYALAGKP